MKVTLKKRLPEGLKAGTILIVEDMSFYISIISQILGNNEFVGKILTANKLSEAYEIISNQYKNGKKIDFIMLDFYLPDGTGMQLAKKIRKTEGLSEIPILLITTEENSLKVIESFEAGVDTYLFKPIEDKIFMEKIYFSWNKYHKESK